jgi:hypothetical protein
MHKQTVDFPYLVSDSVVEEFRHKGFVVTDGVFALSMLEHYASAVDTEVALRTTDDLRKVEEKTIYEQSFVQCMRLWETNDIVRNLRWIAFMARPSLV